MKILPIVAWLACLGSSCLAAGDASLPRSTPEAQGVSSAGLLEFVEAADKSIDAMNSVMVVRHGHVVAEGWWAPYRAESPHTLFSLSKSFTSTAVGLAIAEGKLSVDDPVLKFFPEDAPAEPSKNLKAMRVSDLLRMSTGHRHDPPLMREEKPWVQAFLARPVPDKPGTHFVYNTAATYMLSAIVQKATGTKLLDYLKSRLFDPLGIDHPTWEISPQGITIGGYGLNVRTEDIARFGQLYLRKGEWRGRQLVPASWVEAATALQTSNGSDPKSDWDQGYGYQFWRARHGGYRGDGAFGQFCIVLPERDAVIAITSGVKKMQDVLDVVWDKLLPALKSAPLADDEDTHRKLERTLKRLTLRPQEGSSSLSKPPNKRYVFPSNDLGLEAIALEAGEKEDTLVTRFKGADRRIACGRGEWKPGRMAYGASGTLDYLTSTEQPVAASGAWTRDDAYTAKICFYETPYILKLTLKFSGDQLFFDAETNVGFEKNLQRHLVGKAE
jgi:CubicO group peptidase (beta-lactamase class C family)